MSKYFKFGSFNPFKKSSSLFAGSLLTYHGLNIAKLNTQKHNDSKFSIDLEESDRQLQKEIHLQPPSSHFQYC